jgi:tetratricopeptide (TPR) repeat protein
VDAHAAVPPAEYDTAIREARAGAASAIEKLEGWQRLYPDNKRLVYDLATLLGMQGRHQAALQYYPQILGPDAPALPMPGWDLGRADDALAYVKRRLPQTPSRYTRNGVAAGG